MPQFNLRKRGQITVRNWDFIYLWRCFNSRTYTMAQTLRNKRFMKRSEIDYTVEKTVETLKILEVLEIVPASIEQLITRIGFIPTLNRQLKPDAVRRILITLKLLGYAVQDEKTKFWRKGYKKI